MRIVFMGTPEFAVPSLEALVRAGHEIPAVVTRPDRPYGRKGILKPPAIKVAAARLGLPVWQEAGVGGLEDFVRQLEPEAGVVVAFGRILPPRLLALARHGWINVHASLLPRYRGPAPINWAIINGDGETGVTTMFLAPGVDTGDIILQETVAIPPGMTAGELAEQLAGLGARVLVATLELLARGRAPRRPQDPSRATYAPTLARDDARIRWEAPARAVVNQIHGLNPEPGAYTGWQGREIKVWRAEEAPFAGGPREVRPGTVVRADGKELWVAAGQGGGVALREVQPAGKKSMDIQAFLRGYRVKVSDGLG
ncbi:MAG: methionyl-tRNA formyltransferase [Clostridia bacterium]|nr:MAG: methionyl-tRNA formyltransferase [Clostridia bacterium]